MLMVLLLIFLLFLKLLVETSYGLKPTAFKHQPSGSTIYGFVTGVSLIIVVAGLITLVKVVIQKWCLKRV